MTEKEPITYDSYKSLLLLVNSKSIIDSKLAILSLEYYAPNITLLRYGTYLISYYCSNHVIRGIKLPIFSDHGELLEVISYIQEIAIVRLRRPNRKKKHEFKRRYSKMLLTFTSLYYSYYKTEFKPPYTDMHLEKRVDEFLNIYISTNE